jgi:hypothetical protein
MFELGNYFSILIPQAGQGTRTFFVIFVRVPGQLDPQPSSLPVIF